MLLDINRSEFKVLTKNLRKLLELRDVSVNEIAQTLNIPAQTIGRIFSGDTTDPRISTLQLLANYFNVSIDSLLEENNDRPPLDVIAKKTPQFVPILDWDIIRDITLVNKVPLSYLKEWQPVFLGANTKLSKNAFALESRPSMQPRYPLGTIFVIDPDETPKDGDIVLIKITANGELSLRKLIIDPPKWQLEPVVTGSEVLFYDKGQHSINGVVILNILNTRKKY